MYRRKFANLKQQWSIYSFLSQVLLFSKIAENFLQCGKDLRERLQPCARDEKKNRKWFLEKKEKITLFGILFTRKVSWICKKSFLFGNTFLVDLNCHNNMPKRLESINSLRQEGTTRMALYFFFKAKYLTMVIKKSPESPSIFSQTLIRFQFFLCCCFLPKI